MRVLLQRWDSLEGKLTSISKSKKQLKDTVRRLEKEGELHRLVGDPEKVSIPNHHALADMVKDDTIFLHKDELDVIKY